MLRVVLPVIPVSAVDLVPVSALEIAVAIEIVIVVNVDGIVAAPSGVITPSTAPSGTNHHSDAKRDGGSCSVVASRWVSDRRISIDRRTINHGRVVTRNVNHVRTRWFDHDYLLTLD